MKTASNSRVLRTIPLLITICLVSFPAQAQYGGGTGETNDPCLIYTAEQMNAIGADANDWDKHFKLMADIDLAAYTGTSFNIIGYWRDRDDKKPFTGVFDGNGHTISNFSYASTDVNSIALFSYVRDENALIKDLGLINPNVDAGTGSGVGSLVDYLDEGTVTGCYAQGGSVGGAGDWGVGGLVGALYYGTIINSYSTVSVAGDSRVGGLVGSKWGGGTITNCYSTGSVSGNDSVGGLVGSGGQGVLHNVLHSVWDMETSGLTVSDGGVGLTTAEMMDPYMLGLNGFANDPNWILDAGRDYPRLAWEGTAGQIIPEPIIDWLDGQGTEEEPYRVDMADQLILLGKASILWDKHFILGADINLDPNLQGRQVFSQAVIQVFSGVFDGNDHTISHLTITGGSYLGLFGQLGYGAMISNLGLEAVDVNGIGRYVGGLVGWNNGSITTSYSTGTVTGSSNVGGLVGSNSGSVSNCYSIGTVSGDGYVGGLVGINYGRITNCYSTGSVSGNSDVGGLVGSASVSRVVGCFWDMETSGLSGSAGGVGLTTAEMMDPYMLGLNGFANDPNWILDAGRDYPRLAWEGTAGQIIPEPIIDWLDGQGTEEEPYRVDMADQLILLGKASILWDKHFILGADINLDPNLQGRQVFSQAVIQVFSGVFDGNDHTISHLTITGGSYLGLFGQLGYGAMISNLGLEAVDVNGIGRYVGGLVGWNNGSITTSYSTGTVSGDYHVGGLVGRNYDGNITNSYSIGTVSGDGYVGGLVGRNKGSITSSYSIGTVSGDCYVGGLVGYNSGSITTSYSTGAVSGNEDVGGLVGRNYRGDVIACFWDIETSGLPIMCGSQGDDATGCDDSYGKTTAEMRTAGIFLKAGWDFVAESVNGIEDIWWILEGQDYPRLWWEAAGP